MKRSLICVALMLLASGTSSQIVNNSGSTASDSISLPFYLLDSAGYNTQLLASTDTVFLIVFRPNGVIAFEDSIPQGNARISDNNVSTNIGQYALKLAVADIDGAGADGVFSYTIITDDESLDLETVVRGTFQLYQNSDYNTWATRLQDSLQAVIDSLQSGVNSTRINGSTTVAQRLAGVFSDGGGKMVVSKLTIDSMLIDTLTIDSVRIDTLVITAESTPTLSEVVNIDAWNPITDNDSLIIDKSAQGFIAAGDSVIIDGSALAATANAITAITLATNSIGEPEIGDAAIDAATFATNAINQNTIAASTLDATEFTTDALEAIANRVFRRKLGTVTSGAAVDHFRSTAFTEANDYWNNNQVFFLNGAAANQVARIDDFDATLDSFVISPTLSIAPSVGDSFVVFASLSETGAAGGSTDSGLVSRIVGRKGWGLPQGSGGDSTTAAQRVIGANLTEQGGIAGANRTWSVYVFDTSGTDTPIPSADADVQLTNGTVKLRGTTNASGLAPFTVTDGSWVLVSQETGFILNNLSKTISGNSTDTIKGYDFQVGAPTSPALCRVFGYVYSVGAVPDEGAGVAAFLPAGVARSGNVIVSPFSVSTITDSMGYFYLDLIRSDSLIPAGTVYDLVINRKDGTIAHKRITVPDQTSWLLQW